MIDCAKIIKYFPNNLNKLAAEISERSGKNGVRKKQRNFRTSVELESQWNTARYRSVGQQFICDSHHALPFQYIFVAVFAW